MRGQAPDGPVICLGANLVQRMQQYTIVQCLPIRDNTTADQLRTINYPLFDEYHLQ